MSLNIVEIIKTDDKEIESVDSNIEVSYRFLNTRNGRYRLDEIMGESLINRKLIIDTFVLDPTMLETKGNRSKCNDIINSYDYYLERLKERGLSFPPFDFNLLFPSFELSKKIIELEIQSDLIDILNPDLDPRLFDIGSLLVSSYEYIENYPIRFGYSIDNGYLTHLLLMIFKAKKLMSDREINMFGYLTDDVEKIAWQYS